MACGIYNITNTVNRHFYVGSTANTSVRFSRHRCDLRSGKHDNAHLQRAWNLYGEEKFVFSVVRECSSDQLLLEEQSDLDKFYGTPDCYNLSPNAFRPNLGIPRTEEVKRKISNAQKGKPRFTAEQKEHLSVIHTGRTHSPETRSKMLGRSSSRENIRKAHESNLNKPFSVERRVKVSRRQREMWENRSVEKREELRKKISDKVQLAIVEGRGKPNKIPREEHKNIIDLYLSGTMSKRQLAFKYGVTPGSMSKFLKRNGA